LNQASREKKKENLHIPDRGERKRGVAALLTQPKLMLARKERGKE